MREAARRSNKSIIKWVVLFSILIAINFIQLPYYFTVPGDAKVLSEVIEVEDRHDFEGSLMLTTIRMGKANSVNYVWSLLSDRRELIPEEQIRPEGETDEQYNHRQMMMMTGSQELAVLVAYEYAGKEAFFENYGVLVTTIIPDMDAEGKLEIGDRIVEIDGTEVLEVETLFSVLGEYEIGEDAHIIFERDGETEETTVSVQPFPEEIDPDGERGGIGIANPVTDRELIYDPDVEIDTDQIGGPSAGLMFTLEIYNQLLEEDITKGYHIAGTGSIDEQGNVGRIGGVKQKIYAADEVGADIFFAPDEEGAAGSNYQDALSTAEAIGTDMDIVPINTFEDALDYLDSIEP
ncbi:SepM family pheromone-processing serine protease [Salipaludibacillus daqingensis]|uniref:SepM family pheromone-processing serine protease n=1 Tax=Salipaludibacillus daqingensis TaxID=3041001 RepID=UPI0024738A02|nr:SepM family pheromone-processing serine protease [Salipaludibacillus daqingensis]